MTTRRPLLALAVLLGTLWSLWWFVGRAALRAEPKLPDEICFVAPAVPYDPRSGLQPHAPRPVPANARCPVCGAFPSRVPGWAAQLIFANGDAYFFDSPLTLFIYLRNLQRYAPGRQASEVAASYVHAMGDGGWLPALQAVYVSGSTALGPMRRGNLPAFRNLADAQQFIARNGGVVVHPADITADRLEDVEPHNAGYGALGAMEAATEEQVKQQFDVNFFGLIAVTKAVLPVMRQQKSGVIINVSSVGGRVTFPFASLYHASKFAVEGLTESMQYELNPLGIRMKIVEPGGYKTEFSGRSMTLIGADGPEVYKEGFNKFIAMLEHWPMSENIGEVADVIYGAATDGTETLRYPVGPDALQLVEARRQMDDVEFKKMMTAQTAL